tara:strand:- start:957 stop:1244 length:288 start_codon:yes stop_codon:yes gene_type:complete
MTNPTDEEMQYQARLQSLREQYEKNNSRYMEQHPSSVLSTDEIKEYIQARVREARWAKGGAETVNDFLLWAVITLLALSASGLLYIGYLVAQLGG